MSGPVTTASTPPPRRPSSRSSSTLIPPSASCTAAADSRLSVGRRRISAIIWGSDDTEASGIAEKREAWESLRKCYTTDFSQIDPCTEEVESHLDDTENQADLVCCRQYLQLCFESEEKARKLLYNVSSLPKPGGYFFGITPDSSSIWAKYQKNVEAYHNRIASMKPDIVPNCICSESYMITFEVEEEKFPSFGKKYQLIFAGEISGINHCLVHFPSLIREVPSGPVFDSTLCGFYLHKPRAKLPYMITFNGHHFVLEPTSEKEIGVSHELWILGSTL